MTRLTLPRSQWIALLSVLAVGGLIDGIRLGGIDPAYAAALRRWAATIGELQGAPLALMVSWVGWSLLLVPIGLAIAGWKGSCAAWRFLILLAVVTGLTWVHARWGYFFVVIFSLSLPFALGWIRSRALVYPLFILSLWPVAQLWDARFFPSAAETERRNEAITDFQAMREITQELAQRPPGRGVLAPWWLSPQIAYHSGQPGVAGSSHQSIGGIVASAEFFLSEDPAQAREILSQRQVRYVVTEDAGRLNSNSSQILGRRPSGPTTADRLAIADPSFLPELRLILTAGPFRLYEWRPAATQEESP